MKPCQTRVLGMLMMRLRVLAEVEPKVSQGVSKEQDKQPIVKMNTKTCHSFNAEKVLGRVVHAVMRMMELSFQAWEMLIIRQERTFLGRPKKKVNKALKEVEPHSTKPSNSTRKSSLTILMTSSTSRGRATMQLETTPGELTIRQSSRYISLMQSTVVRPKFI